ncbi:MAG: hypothetical protein JSU95_17940, partial [Betaproteobacteria bacterium]
MLKLLFRTINANRLTATVLLAACLMAATPAAAQTESETEEEQRYKREAVERIVDSHDNVLILKGGELMVRQQAVRAAEKLLSKWGREQNLGMLWWEDRPEWQAAKSEMLAAADEVLEKRFIQEAWLKGIWTKYTMENFSGEQASVIANHFETEGGIAQRRLMDWYLGETTLFYYTFTDRFDYETKETQAQLKSLQRSALSRIPVEDVHFSKRHPEAFAFIACSPDSEYCPGLHYWKMLTIPMMGAVFRHFEQVTREMEARMISMRPQLQ